MIAPVYLIVLALLLWLVIGARGKWWLKALLVLSLLLFTFLMQQALNSYRGWPVSATPPKQSILIASEINEPDRLTNSKGSIYLWLIPEVRRAPILGYSPTDGEPKAYRVPYSRPLHEQLNRAAQQQAQAQKQGGQISIALSHQKGVWREYKLPIPGLPQKHP